MEAVISKRQCLGPQYCGKVERGIKMGKERAAARSLPFQVSAKPLGIDGNEDEILLPLEMRRQRAGKLVLGGKMDEAVAEIVGRPRKTPVSLGLLKGGLGQDFIDGLCHGFRPGTVAASSSPNKEGTGDTEMRWTRYTNRQ
jgi:hypothetical protein